MDNSTQVAQDGQHNASLPEGTILLNSASEAGNWDLVIDLISNADISLSDIRQSFLLQKLTSDMSHHQLFRNITKKIFSTIVKDVAEDVFIKAAHCDNWDILIAFLSTTCTLLEDEKSLLSVIRLMASSQMLQAKPFLHMDVFTALWIHAKQKIIDSKDKSIQNSLVQLAAKLNMWSRVCDLLVAKPDLNLLDRDGLSVLHRLVMCPDSRFYSLLPVLLENGAEVNAKTSEGNTVLHLAAKHQRMATLGKTLNVVDTESGHQSQNVRTQIIDDYGRKCIESKCQTLTTLIESCCCIDDGDDDGNTAAILAAKNDNWEFLILLLKHGARTDTRDLCQRSVLHFCALRGSSLDRIACATIVTLGLNNGAGVNDPDTQGCTALHLAVESHSWTVFEFLVKLGADCMCRDRTGYNVLHKMALAGSEHIQDIILLFFLLAERGAEFNTMNPEGDAVIHIATRLQNWTLVKHLVYLGADINLCNIEGFTVLHLLALSKPLSQEYELWKQKELCKNEMTFESFLDFLLDRGVGLNLRCLTTETAFHMAARHENWFMVKYLMQRGANILEFDIEGISVFQRLICSKSEIHDTESFLSFLHDNGGPSSVATAGGNSLLQLAAKYEKWEIVDYILKHWGGNVDQLDSEGCSILRRMATSRGRTFKEGLWCFSIRPIFNSFTNLDEHERHDLIHQAAAAGNVDVVDALLDNFDDVNRADDEGFTVLHRVAQCCVSTSVAIIRRLVEKGADINKRCPDGNTALHLAAKSNNWLAVQHLLKNRASANTLDTEGMTVLHRLLSQSHFWCKQCAPSREIKIQVLSQAALINQRDLHDNTPLHIALENECWDMVISLLGRGASVNERDSSGCTALHTIAKRRNSRFSKLFSLNQADVQSNCISKVTDSKANRHTSISSGCVTCSKNSGLNVQILNSSPKSEESSLQMCQKILELLILRGADVRARDPEGNTPIQLAAKHGNMDMVERLLEFQDNINETDSEGFTLLSRVAQTSSPRCEHIARRLVSKGVDVNRTCPDGMSPLQLSVVARNWPVTLQLWHSTSRNNMNVTLQEQYLIIHRFIEDVNLDVCTLIDLALKAINLKKDILMHRSPDGATALQLAIIERKWILAAHILDLCEYADIESLTGSSVFHALAEIASHLSDPMLIIGLMPNKNLNINFRDDNGNTPLNILAKSDRWSFMKSFVELGADVNMPDSEGWTVLHKLAKVIWKDLSDILIELVECGADIEKSGPGHKTAVILALEAGNWPVFWKLIQLGASYDWAQAEKCLLLKHLCHFPKRNIQAEQLRRIVDYLTRSSINCSIGASIPSQAQESLEEGVRCSESTVAKHLQSGVDVIMLQRSFEKCVRYSNWTVAKELLQSSPHIDIKKLICNRPLIHVMVTLYKEDDHVIWVSFLTELLHRGFDINTRDERGRTPLMKQTVLSALKTIDNDAKALYRVLLEKGVNPSIVDKSGNSLLTLMINFYDMNSSEIVKVLIKVGLIFCQPQFEDGDSVQMSHPLYFSQLVSAVHEMGPSVLKIVVECGAISNCDLVLLKTKYQRQEIRGSGDESIKSEAKRVLQILEEAASQPRSLKSLCRLAVSRSLPFSVNRSDVMSLPIPTLLRNYLVFTDEISKLHSSSEDEEGDPSFEDDTDSEDHFYYYSDEESSDEVNDHDDHE